MRHYMRKFGPQAEGFLKDPNNHMKQRGRAIGLSFDYHEGSKVFNSFDCHRLLFYAKEKHGNEKQNQLQEIFFQRYFKDGANLGEREEIISAAATIGLGEAEVNKVLSSDFGMDEVREELEESHSKVSGVPAFTFPSGQEISGGQEVETFASILRREASILAAKGTS